MIRKDLMEKTFVIVKPDGIKAHHIGDILSRFEHANLKLEFIKLTQLTRAQCEVHYAQHIGKPFFEDLVSYMTDGPVVGMILSGTDAIAQVRKMAGATDPSQADPGTIRGDYATSIDRNIVHTSDSESAVKREFANIFPGETL